MTTTQRIQTAEDLLVGYRGFALSLLIDSCETFTNRGGRFVAGDVRTWAVLPDGRAYPVACGDIVSVYSEEDGESFTTRCGAPIARAVEAVACEGHQAAIDAWRSLSEAERCEVERREDEESYWR